MKPQTASALLLAASASAYPAATDGIRWGECEQPTGGLPVQCGKLDVPLDWLDESSNKTMITLELIKYPAKTQPAPRGSILLNFGGPGQDGLNSFIGYYPLQAPIIGDEFDMIGWDPRGTRNTIPLNCYDLTNPLAGTYIAYGAQWWNTSDVAPATLWAETAVLAELCYNKHKDTANHMGMAAVSRDMIAIVDALGEDGMLRYWGVSGGTVLGATVAAMFPERVDKVIIDAVLDSDEFYNKPVETSWGYQADDTLIGVFDACIELGPEKCPLANQGKTTDDLVAVWEKLINSMKFHPIPYLDAKTATGGYIEYNTLMYFVHSSLYRPMSYQNLTIALDALVRRDAYTYLTYSGQLDAPADPNAPTDPAPFTTAVYGIRCGDKKTDATELADFFPYVEEAKGISKWFYGFGLGPNALLCAHWRSAAKERYAGPWEGIKTKNPLLIINNRFDPVTPVQSAKKMQNAFEGSYLLELDAFGHTTIVRGSESTCAFDIMKAYLTEGTLPSEPKLCNTNKKITELFV